jgi:hypothetical protein
MPVDIDWDGVSLAKSAAMREEDGGWFVELEQPMPVGTRLTLSGDVQATVTVARVHEGIGAGMVVRKGDVRPAATASGTASDGETAEKQDGGADKPEGGGDKKEKRRRKR